MKSYYDKRIQRSKNDLKQTFLRILKQKKFEQITISEIVREADYNRGTFYTNFESKDNLLKEVIQDVLGDMILQIRKPYRDLKRVDMKEICTEDITLFKYFKDNAEIYKLLLSDHIRVDFRYQMAQAIEKLFLEEYDYELNMDTLLDPKWLYVYRSHGIAGLIIRWMEEDFPTTPNYMSKQVVELMLTSTEVFHVKN